MEKLAMQAEALNLSVSRIVDYGHFTAIAIGPDKADTIDEITRELPLL